jgi:hypothetical protein
MMAMQIIVLTYLSAFAATQKVTGFSINSFVRPRHRTVHFSSYGRGAEIWPECNENQIQLSDSFPGGVIPSDVAESLAYNRLAPSELYIVVQQSRFPRPIQRILARVPKVKIPQNDDVSFDKTPTVISFALLLNGLVRPLDVAVAAGISGYLAVLYYWARSPRSDGFSPHVPSLPPQGHVPDLVINPLGISFANSNGYNTWLKTGAVLSLFAPIALLLECTVFAGHGAQMEAARSCARPLFLLCCQSMVELKFRQIMVSSPFSGDARGVNLPNSANLGS